MLILESQLRRVIFEEVQLYLFEQYIDEALKEVGISKDDPAYAEYRGQTRRAFMKSLLLPAAGAAITGATGGAVSFAKSKDTAAWERRKEKREKEKEEYQKTDDYVIEALNNNLRISANFQWEWGPQKHWVSGTGEVSFPTEFPTLSDKNGTIIVLSADYGVWRKVLDDFEEQKNQPNKQPKYTKEQIIRGTGTAEKWSEDFPKDWDLPTDSAKCLKLGQTCEDLLSHVREKGFNTNVPKPKSAAWYRGIYLPFDIIPDDMVLPNSGMSKTELYVRLWHKFVVKRD